MMRLIAAKRVTETVQRYLEGERDAKEGSEGEDEEEEEEEEGGEK